MIKLIPLVFLVLLFSCQNDTRLTRQKENKNYKEKSKDFSSYWYWIDENFCFPKHNYCVDSLLIHHDSISKNITYENIDDYIPDSITKVRKIINVYPVKLNGDKKKVFENFNLMTYLWGLLHDYVVKGAVSYKYKNKFPVTLSYFFDFDNIKSIELVDTFYFRTYSDFYRKHIVRGELKMLKVQNVALKSIVIKELNIDHGTKIQYYKNQEKKENLLFELSLYPLNPKVNPRELFIIYNP